MEVQYTELVVAVVAADLVMVYHKVLVVMVVEPMEPVVMEVLEVMA